MRTLACLAALALCAGAAADTIKDRADTKDGSLDLASARVSYNRSTDEVVAVVTTHEDFTPKDLVASKKPPGSICLNLWTRAEPGDGQPEYDACITAKPGARGLQASVARYGRAGSPHRLGPAEVDQPSPTRIELRLSPRRIGRPESVRYTVQGTTFGGDCPPVTGCEDFVPDRPKAGTLRLPAPPSG